MKGVFVTPLRKIFHPKGDIFHAMKKSDNGFSGFGEAYFSKINKREIKGWKKHHKMTLNLVVPIGKIKFIIFNECDFLEVEIGQKNYKRLTVNPGLWVAFQGIEDTNICLNISSIEHDPLEASQKNLDQIPYAW